MDRYYPPTFRAEIIEPIADSIRSSQSCSVVGLGGCGKSNVVRFLRDHRDARQIYFGQQANRILWIVVDCNRLGDFDDASVYALLMKSLARTLLVSAEPKYRIAQLNEIENHIVTFDRLQLAVELLSPDSEMRFVFVLDDCDQLIRNSSPTLLRRLRALRDEFKRQLVYVTFTRHRLTSLRVPSPEFEKFSALLIRTFPLGPYARDDANCMLDELINQIPPLHALTVTERSWLLRLSGRHAGLLKSAYDATHARQFREGDAMLHFLCAIPKVQNECQIIWNGLEKIEQEALTAFVQKRPLHRFAQKILEWRQVLIEDTPGGLLRIFSPLFESFVAKRAHPLQQRNEI